MASNVLSTVRSCQNCTRLREKNEQQKLIKLFHAAKLLEVLAMDLLGTLEKSTQGNTFILVMTDQFTKTKRCIPLQITTAAAATAALLKY